MLKTVLKRGLAAAMVAAFLGVPAGAGAATYPAGFEERVLTSGLNTPVDVAFAPDGTAFIAQKPGQVIRKAPSSPATELLDISPHVNNYSDRGFEGIAVDRDFATNGYVYLAYVYELQPMVGDQSGPMVSRVTRIRVLPGGTLENPSDPETVILGSYVAGPCHSAPAGADCIPADGESHMIGTVLSDPRDGTLWVGSGDASDFNRVDDRALRSLDENSLAGKIMHVDAATGRGLAGHPFCPAVADLSQPCTKVHAKGFRNPFRFHLRPDGTLLAGDVGWNTTEELDVIDQGGGSYGWPCYEGLDHTPGYQELGECAAYYAREGTAQAERPPTHSYGRSEGAAVIGGPTYTDTDYPAGYRGAIFYGDFVGTKVRLLRLNAGDPPTTTDFATGWTGTDLEIGPDGDLYYVDIFEGALKRVVYTPGNASPHAVASASPKAGGTQFEFDFTGSGSDDPDDDPLTYDWDFGDGSAHSSEADPTHTYPDSGPFDARLTVSDGRGLSDTATLRIAPGSTAPQARIDAPAADADYRDGDLVDIRGTAIDPEEGELPASSLQWRVRLLHRDHFHPILEFNGVREASFLTQRDHDADSSYEITLTAKDSTGLRSPPQTILIHPQAVTARIVSEPGGAPISYGGRSAQTPYTQPTAIGYLTSVSASEAFFPGGREYRFTSWSDGGARLHDLTVPESDFELVARYEPVPQSAPPPAVDPPFESGDSAPPGYRTSVLGTRGLAALYGLGDRGRFAREATGGPAGSYRGGARRVRALMSSIGDAAARAFDGVDDSVALPRKSLGRPPALSVEMWARPRKVFEPGSALPLREYLFLAAVEESADGFGLFVGGKNRVGAVAAGGDAGRRTAVGPALRPRRTYHLVATYDGARLRLYVNGRLRASRAYAGSILWRRDRKVLVGRSAPAPSGFEGRLDEVALYHRALRAREVAAHWAAR